MGKKIVLVCLLSVLSTGLIMAGCGKKKSGADASAEAPTSTAVDESQINDDNQNVQAPSVEGTDDIEKLHEEYMEMYESFLDNQEPVYFSWFMKSDNSGIDDWKYSSYADAFNSSSAYVFSDFMKTVCDRLYADSGEAVYPMDIKYSFLDCGNDGIPELAVEVDGMMESFVTMNDVWIMKCIDGKLQVILYKQFGYRSQFDINEYGWYSYGGSTGAASWVIEHECIGSDGTSVFDYGESNTTSCWALYIPDNSEYQNVADEQGIGENIEIEQFYVNKHNDDQESYFDFLQNSMWIYYEIDDHYERIPDNEGIYEKDSAFRTFWDATDMPLNTESEINDAIWAHRDRIGLKEELVNGDPLEWTQLEQQRLDKIYAWKPEEPDIISLEEPSWEYYYYGDEAKPATSLKLEVENKTPNDIIDENVWFAAMEMEEPDRLNYSDDTYTYKLYGEDPDGLRWYPYMMDIYNSQTGEVICSLDFSSYYKPENIKSGDEAFVEEAIHYAVIKDDVLYVSTFHNTYASSAPQNGYITALDMKDGYKVLWRSKPLSCNSNNFIVTDDAIICGYGFTAEDDYIYVLDRECGMRTSSIKVKTSPEWFCLKDDMLFVRCYDTDYVFNVK